MITWRISGLESLPELGVAVNDERGELRSVCLVTGTELANFANGQHIISVPFDQLDLPSLQLTRVSLIEQGGAATEFRVVETSLGTPTSNVAATCG